MIGVRSSVSVRKEDAAVKVSLFPIAVVADKAVNSKESTRRIGVNVGGLL